MKYIIHVLLYKVLLSMILDAIRYVIIQGFCCGFYLIHLIDFMPPLQEGTFRFALVYLSKGGKVGATMSLENISSLCFSLKLGPYMAKLPNHI